MKKLISSVSALAAMLALALPVQARADLKPMLDTTPPPSHISTDLHGGRSSGVNLLGPSTAPPLGASLDGPSPSSLGAPAPVEGKVGIAVIVNDDVITFSDIENRIQLYLIGSTGEPPPEVRAQLEKSTLDHLIDEKLELQEAKELGITVSDESINGAFASVAQQNHLTADEFKSKLTDAHVKTQTILDQIKAELAWGQVVRRKLRPQISITETEIDNELDQQAKAGTLPASAIPGGVAENPAVPAAAADDGVMVHIKQIVIPVNDSDPEAIIQAKTTRASALKSEVKSCDDMDKKMKDFSGEGTGDLGKGPLTALPATIRDAIAHLGIGELSDPVRGKNGIAVVMICDREGGSDTKQEKAETPAPAAAAALDDPKDGKTPADAKNNQAARNEVANKLGLERLNHMAERYLRDLRASAFIDKRT